MPRCCGWTSGTRHAADAGSWVKTAHHVRPAVQSCDTDLSRAGNAIRGPGADTAVGLLATQVLVPVGSGGDRWLQGSATPSTSGAQLAKVQSRPAQRQPGPGRQRPDRYRQDARDVGEGRDRRHAADLSPCRKQCQPRGRGRVRPRARRGDHGPRVPAAHVTSGFDNTLLVRGRDVRSLAPFGTVTDAAGYAVEQNTDRELNAWANDPMASLAALPLSRPPARS